MSERTYLATVLDDECTLCQGDALPGDLLVQLRHDGQLTTAHLMCTSDGVERWCREGRPGHGPLLWDRSERPRWHSDQSDRPLALVGAELEQQRVHGYIGDRLGSSL